MGGRGFRLGRPRRLADHDPSLSPLARPRRRPQGCWAGGWRRLADHDGGGLPLPSLGRRREPSLSAEPPLPPPLPPPSSQGLVTDVLVWGPLVVRGGAVTAGRRGDEGQGCSLNGPAVFY